MSSRQRVMTALSHKEPDKVPIDLAATTVSSITYPAYAEFTELPSPDAGFQSHTSPIFTRGPSIPGRISYSITRLTFERYV